MKPAGRTGPSDTDIPPVPPAPLPYGNPPSLREKAPDCLVMVGGAVLNQDYADMIGADFYGKDAMQSVHYAQKVFS